VVVVVVVVLLIIALCCEWQICWCVFRVAFPSAEVRCVERDGTKDIVYAGVVRRANAAAPLSLGMHSGTNDWLVFIHCNMAEWPPWD